MKKLVTSLFFVSALFAQTPQTITIVGQTGPQGPKGDTGTQGPAGLTGPAGVAGAKGATGPNGVAGPSGATGSIGLTGSIGPQGPQGIPGPVGPQGPAGADGGGTGGSVPACVTTVGGMTCPINLGFSGALQQSPTGGSLDINPAVVARLLAANVFGSMQTFQSGINLLTTTRQAICGSGIQGTFWFVNNGGIVKDSVQVCLFDGSGFNWVKLY